MGYDKEKWLKRVRSRSDISSYLTHLTRAVGEMNNVEMLLKILNDRKLIGSQNEGFIKGKSAAVCFQDAPVRGVVENLIHEQYHREELGNRERYYPVGLMFSKPYVFNKGGRPVIYETREIAESAYNYEQWRVVTFDLSDEDAYIDWTHEREWRVKGDFEFEIEEVYVLLTNKGAYKDFISRVDKETLLNIAGIIVLDPVLS